MDYVRFKLVEQCPELLIYSGMAILIECLGQIDHMQLYTRVRRIEILCKNIIRQELVLLSCEDMYLMPVSESLRQALRIYFGASIIAHGIAMYDKENFHAASTFIVVRSLRPTSSIS